MRTWFFEKTKKYLGKLTKIKVETTQINKIKDKRETVQKISRKFKES